MQAEAPPGALLTKFKQLLEGGGMSAADVAFYFVHWLTDLAGAEGTPLAGNLVTERGGQRLRPARAAAHTDVS